MGETAENFKSIEAAKMINSFSEEGVTIKHQLMTDFDKMAAIGDKENGSRFDESNTLLRIVVSNSKDLKSPSDDPLFHKNLMLQRALATARAIDHVLEQQQKINDSKRIIFLQKQRDILLKTFKEMANTDIENTIPAVHQCESEAYAKFAEVLRDCDLAPGCKSTKDYGKLLEFYRNLGSLLDPAESVKTVIQHEGKEFTITQTPITKKTEKQKEQIDNYIDSPEQLKEFPGKRDRRFPKKTAFQIAAAYYKDLLKDDTRRLPEQCRHWIPMTVKNGYVVDLSVKNGNNPEKNIGTFVRVATPVLTGDDQGIDRKQFVDANLEQINLALENKGPSTKHWFCMNFPILPFNNKENRIVSDLRDGVARREIKDMKFNNTPRWFSHHTYSPETLRDAGRTINAKLLAAKTSLSMQVNRYNVSSGLAADLLLSKESVVNIDETLTDLPTGIETKKNIPIVSCASARDRTGGEVDLITQKIMVHELEVEAETAERLSAISLNTAVIATMAIPGAPYVKGHSVTGIFSRAYNHYFANRVCDFNKSARVGELAPMSDDLKKEKMDKLIAEQDAALKTLLQNANINIAIVRGADNKFTEDFYNELKDIKIDKTDFVAKRTKELALEVVKRGMKKDPKQNVNDALKSLINYEKSVKESNAQPENEALKDKCKRAEEHCLRQAKSLRLSGNQKLGLCVVAVVAAILLVAAGLAFIPTGGLSIAAYGTGGTLFAGSAIWAKVKPEANAIGKDMQKLTKAAKPKPTV